MVNTAFSLRSRRGGSLPIASVLVTVYALVVVGTLPALVILSFVAPRQASATAWWHELLVAAFAVLLPLRLRAASSGKRSAVRAVGLIAAVLLLVNVVEALIPAFLPLWMRMEMLGIAVLMCGVVFDVARWATRHH